MVLNRLFPGLLDSRHMNEMLKRTLKKCANPLGSRDGNERRAAAGEGTRKQVRTYMHSEGGGSRAVCFAGIL
jgi:hypothetical protein